MRKSPGLALIGAALLAGCGSATSTTTQTAPPQAATAPTAATRAAGTSATPTRAARKPSRPEHRVRRAEPGRKAAEEQAKRAREAAQQRLAVSEAQSAAREANGRAQEAAATSNAKRLVETWKRQPVSAGDANVVLIAQHLVSLSHKCSRDVTTLAADLAGGVQGLKKAGITESPVEVAARLDEAVSGGKGAAYCRRSLAAVLAQIQKG